MNRLKYELISLYIEHVNNYLTVEKHASDLCITPTTLAHLLVEGKVLYDANEKLMHELQIDEYLDFAKRFSLPH